MPVSRLAPGAFAGVLVFGLAWFDGGFYAPAWGVVSLGLLGVCGCAIVLSERLYLSRLALVSIGGLFGLAAWTLMSGFWTSDLTKTISDAELAFVYPIALTASLLVARRTGTSALAIGTLVGDGGGLPVRPGRTARAGRVRLPEQRGCRPGGCTRRSATGTGWEHSRRWRRCSAAA